MKLLLNDRNSAVEVADKLFERLLEVLEKSLNFTHTFHLLIFFKINFFKKILSGTQTIRVSNSLDPDQDGHSVSPVLGPIISRPQKRLEYDGLITQFSCDLAC